MMILKLCIFAIVLIGVKATNKCLSKNEMLYRTTFIYDEHQFGNCTNGANGRPEAAAMRLCPDLSRDYRQWKPAKYISSKDLCESHRDKAMAVFGDDGKYDPDTGDVLVLARCSYPLMVVMKQSCDVPFREFLWENGEIEKYRIIEE